MLSLFCVGFRINKKPPTQKSVEKRILKYLTWEDNISYLGMTKV